MPLFTLPNYLFKLTKSPLHKMFKVIVLWHLFENKAAFKQLWNVDVLKFRKTYILLYPCLPLFGFAYAPPEVWVLDLSTRLQAFRSWIMSSLRPILCWHFSIWQIHVFFGLPALRPFAGTMVDIAFLAGFSGGRLWTWQYHRICLSLCASVMGFWTNKLPRMYLLLMWSSLVTPVVILSIFISAAVSLLSYVLYMVQHSDAYKSAGLTTVA